MEVSDICCKNIAQKEFKIFIQKLKTNKYTEKDLIGTKLDKKRKGK